MKKLTAFATSLSISSIVLLALPPAHAGDVDGSANRRAPIDTCVAYAGVLFPGRALPTFPSTGGGRPVYRASTGSWIPWVDDLDPAKISATKVTDAPAAGSALPSGSGWDYTPNVNAPTGPDGFGYALFHRTSEGCVRAVPGRAKVMVYDANDLALCTSSAVVDANGMIQKLPRANFCALYDAATTRKAGGQAPEIPYFLNYPSDGGNAPKAVVVLIGGSDLAMGIAGDPATGEPSLMGGQNFLVRTAQMFADAGYIAVSINRPSDVVPPNSTLNEKTIFVDQYRLSVTHAVDLLTLLRHVNTGHLNVFLAGTSVGALSAVAHNLIATGISLSSPTTGKADAGDDFLFVGESSTSPLLRPSWVQRPTHLLWHATMNANLDCKYSLPADAEALHQSLLTSGVNTAAETMNAATPALNADPCGPYGYHGFLGVEKDAVKSVTDWMDEHLAMLGGNTPPRTRFSTVLTGSGKARQLDLSTLVDDPDGPAPLTYKLSHEITALPGSALTIEGAVVTYVPPPGVKNETDYFVFDVEDALGGVGAAVVTVKIGN